MGGTRLNIVDFGARNTTAVDSAAAITTALTTASQTSHGATVVAPPGVYRTDTEIVIPPRVSLLMEPGALIRTNHPGDGIRVEGGSTGGQHHRIAVEKHSKRWYTATPETASVGVRVTDCIDTRLDIARIVGYGATGLHLDPNHPTSNGSVTYNTFTLGYLVDNKVSLRLDTTPTGNHANQNLFIGGRLRHSSSSPDQHPGTVEIRTESNNCVYIGLCLEGGRAERSLLVYSSFNSWYGCRFEAAAPIEFDDTNGPSPGSCNFNQVNGGYYVGGPDNTNPGMVTVIDGGHANRVDGAYGAVLYSRKGWARSTALDLATDLPTATHNALQVSRGWKRDGTRGTIEAVITHDGRYGMLDTNGVMRYLTRPTGSGPATWS